MADLLVGLDAGTSVIKAVAFDADGNALYSTAKPNAITQVAGGGVEQDMAETWRNTAEVLRELRARIPDSDRIAVLSITGQGDGTWLMDADGEPVGGAWLWLDARSGAIVEQLRRSGVGESVYRLTGTGLNQSNQSGHLLWMAQHEPERLERAATAFHCKDWLYFKCTGERATDPSEGVFTFGDFRERRYSDEVLRVLRLERYRRLLPDIVDGVQHQGSLHAEAARQTGLPQGLPVVLAPVDILCTGLGGGLYDPDINVGFTILGSTGMHMRAYHALEEIELRDQAGYVMPFVMPELWGGMMSNMAATLNIDWMLDWAGRLLGDFGADVDRKDLLAGLDARAADAEPGKVLYHPFIFECGERGPFVNPSARAQFLGLTRNTGPYDLLRAIYDSLGLAARDCYEGMGHVPDEIRVGGGAMRSPTIRRILASAVGRPLRMVNQEEAGAAGAAMVGQLSLDEVKDLTAVCARWVTPRFGERVEPDPQLQSTYEDLLPVYRAGYEQMNGFWRTLAEYRTRG